MKARRIARITVVLTVAVVSMAAVLVWITKAPSLASESPSPLVAGSAGGQQATSSQAVSSTEPGKQATNLATSQPFTFAITCDVRVYSGPGTYDDPDFFRGACEGIASVGQTDFMVGPGDIDPVKNVHWTITQTLGVTYTWYPVVGNHELPDGGYEDYSGENMDYLRDYDYGTVNLGPTGCPSTTFSFDYENVHFVMLNEYCDTSGDTATDGDVPDHLFDWLAADLAATDREYTFVFGHEPGYPQPDADNGRLRHENDSLNQYPSNRDRFWELMEREDVTAYICGHTHNFSAVYIDGVWQIDAGHARGIGDTGARSTFVLIQVDGSIITYEVYRDNYDGGPYVLSRKGLLVGPPRVYLPLVEKTH